LFQILPLIPPETGITFITYNIGKLVRIFNPLLKKLIKIFKNFKF